MMLIVACVSAAEVVDTTDMNRSSDGCVALLSCIQLGVYGFCGYRFFFSLVLASSFVLLVCRSLTFQKKLSF